MDGQVQGCGPETLTCLRSKVLWSQRVCSLVGIHVESSNSCMPKLQASRNQERLLHIALALMRAVPPQHCLTRWLDRQHSARLLPQRVRAQRLR